MTVQRRILHDPGEFVGVEARPTHQGAVDVGLAIELAALDDFTDPPYWMRTAAAPSRPTEPATTARTRAHTACASSALAVRPVPIAQIGS